MALSLLVSQSRAKRNRNNQYLLDWAKENGIKQSHYKVIGDKGFTYHADKNGVPILVEKEEE